MKLLKCPSRFNMSEPIPNFHFIHSPPADVNPTNLSFKFVSEEITLSHTVLSLPILPATHLPSVLGRSLY